MYIDLNEYELIQIITNTEHHNMKAFIDKCLIFDIAIFDALNVLYDYLNEYKTELTDVREVINNGLVTICNNDFKAKYDKDFYFIEIKDGVYLVIE